MEPQWEGEKGLAAAGKGDTLPRLEGALGMIGLNAETKKLRPTVRRGGFSSQKLSLVRLPRVLG